MRIAHSAAPKSASPGRDVQSPRASRIRNRSSNFFSGITVGCCRASVVQWYANAGGGPKAHLEHYLLCCHSKAKRCLPGDENAIEVDKPQGPREQYSQLIF